MATEIKHKKVLTVKRLKEFLTTIPDSTPVRGSFDEQITAYLMQADEDESGPKRFLNFEEEL